MGSKGEKLSLYWGWRQTGVIMKTRRLGPVLSLTLKNRALLCQSGAPPHNLAENSHHQ